MTMDVLDDGLVTLSALVDALALIEGGAERDRGFVRRLASALHERGEKLELLAVEAMGLTDVVATFAMEERVRLVVTGRPLQGPGEVTVRWHEREFEEVQVRLLAAPRQRPYLFATLDYRWRGQAAELLRPADGLPAGQRVRVRALATVGAEVQWRIVAMGIEATVAEDAIRLEDASASDRSAG